jgi:PKD repeat protein
LKTKVLIIGCLLLSLGYAMAQGRRFKLDASLRTGDFEPQTIVVKYKLSQSWNGTVSEPSARTNAALRKVGVQAVHRLFPKQTQRSVQNPHIPQNSRTLVDLSSVYTIQIPPSQNLEAAINVLLTDSTVEYAEPLYTNFQAMYVPNDPQANPSGGAQYALRNIKAYDAWDVHKGSGAVTIGVVDFGFEVTHEDLKGKIKYNTADPVDGIDNDKDGYIDNYAGWNIINNNHNLVGNNHGTRVAGCAAGQGDNGIGIAGVALNCPFIPISGYDPASGRFSGFAGLVYLAEKGCKVINLSWGRTGPASYLEQEVINYAAINHDVVITASAGNEGSNISRYWWPASYENVLSVAATNASDLKWGTAGGSAYNDKVDISAPGQDIISSVDGNSYNYDSGTSYSSPIVAGAAALVRSMYPNLSAAEVAQRLMATADDIYSIPGNSPYIGKLGSGRLNVYRALTETSTKSVVMVDKSVKNSQNQPYFLTSEANELTIYLKNLASPLSNAQLSLTTNSPYVSITTPAVSLGFVSTDATVSNITPFKVTVSSEAFANQEVMFTATLTDGTYKRSFSWTAYVNPDYLDIDVNQTKVTATSNGRIGYADGYSFWNAGIATNQQAKGNGIRFQANQLLFEAGLVVATDENHVSDGIRNESPSYSRNQQFESVRNVAFQNYPITDVLAGGIIEESWYHPGRIGLKIQHQTFAWKDAPNDQFVIVEYKIRNQSGANLDSLYTGIFADWEIGTRQNNKADWDADRKLGYVFNPSGNYPYAGVQLLTDQAPHYYAFDNQSGINIFNGFTPAEKFQAISSGTAHTQTAANADDVAHLLGAKIRNLAEGDSAVVAFAIVTGNSIADLQKTADAARQKFVEINRSPKPVVADVQTCRGGRVMITPTPGQTFKFYQKQQDGTLQPLSAGRELEVENVINDTTFFVTNADSLYESEPVPVKVRVFEASFQANKDSLSLHDKDILQLTNQTTGAVRWTWDFGDGTTSTEANPSHAYAKEGQYNLILITQNMQGCTDTLVRVIRVFPGIVSPTPVVEPISICAGDSVIIRPSNAQVFAFFNQDQELIRTGTEFRAGRISRDTLFYVVATDYIVQSMPVIVTITVAPIKAGFSMANDTIDLTFQQVLQATDTSTGGIRRKWDFGDGTATSTEANPSHAYAEEGTYTVTLEATNTQGCTNVTSQQVTVMRSTDRLAEGILIGPNPTSDFVTINRSPGLRIAKVTLQVYDALGQRIYETENIPYLSELDFQSFGKGMYVVVLAGDNQRLVRRIVVN